MTTATIATIDEAWAAVEAALPDGWRPLIGSEPKKGNGWWATASEPPDEFGRWSIVSTSENGVLYPTMAEALLALVAALTSQPMTGDQP